MPLTPYANQVFLKIVYGSNYVPELAKGEREEGAAFRN